MKPKTIAALLAIALVQPLFTGCSKEGSSSFKSACTDCLDSDADGIGALSLDFPLQQFTDPNPNAGNAFGSKRHRDDIDIDAFQGCSGGFEDQVI